MRKHIVSALLADPWILRVKNRLIVQDIMDVFKVCRCTAALAVTEARVSYGIHQRMTGRT